MTKRALKRMVREGAFDAGQFEDPKVRRLPVERGWSPIGSHAAGPDRDADREQGYVKTIKPKSIGQKQLMDAIDAKAMVLALGPAGTGKTYLAIAKAVEALEAGTVGRIVLSRPAVDAGESIGFLPGDMKEKVDPYLRPLYDALNDCMPPEQVERRLANGEIEIAPIAFMRGRTLADSFIILDEAQNTTREQMKMFLTRFGQNSRMVVCGDPRQVDIPGGPRMSGLNDAVEKLEGIDGFGTIRFTAADVVRHPIVGRIVEAYEGGGEGEGA